MYKQSIFASVLISFVACGGDDGGKSVTVPDAGSNGSNAGSAKCLAPASYSFAFGSDDVEFAQAGDSGSNGPDIFFQGNISEANPIDLITIELWTGGPDFPTTAGSGTFDFSKNNNNLYSKCGACAYIAPQVPLGSDGSPDFDNYDLDNDTYEAESGTITVADAGSGSALARTGTFTGTLNNVVFKHHEVTGTGSAAMEIEAADGCQTSMATLAFTATIDPPSNNLIGNKASRTMRMKLLHRHR